MADVVDRATRSRMMSGIRGRDTRPELVIRHGLHRAGFRYRLTSSLPGRPDLVFPSRKAVIFVHGCFWHRHDCPLFRWPSTRAEFWKEKINGNHERDDRVQRQLLDEGWRVLVVWECALKGTGRMPMDRLIERVVRWLRGRVRSTTIRGRHHE
jgi:DNA mismatch endonuclease, patch repair protein